MRRLIAELQLQPHSEGGWYRQTYESQAQAPAHGGTRPLLNTIYYLLTRESPIGYFHLNRSDITHFCHLGGPAVYSLISPTGEYSEVTLGTDLSSGQRLAFTVPGGWWKSSHLAEDAELCLISEAVSPGFDYADRQMATVELFSKLFPDLLPRVQPFILA